MHVLCNRFLYDRKKCKYELGTTHKVKSYKTQSQENKNKHKFQKLELEKRAKTKVGKVRVRQTRQKKFAKLELDK